MSASMAKSSATICTIVAARDQLGQGSVWADVEEGGRAWKNEREREALRLTRLRNEKPQPRSARGGERGEGDARAPHCR